MKTLGEKIRELRRKKGLSQEELAFEIDISRQTVSKWESDAMQPTTDNIRALCEFFDVTAEYFIGDDKPTTNETVATVSIDSVNAGATTVDEVIGTKDESTTSPVARKTYSKKKILVLTILISLAAVIFCISAIIGGFAIYLTNIPSDGPVEVDSYNADALAIVCTILAVTAISAVITLATLLKINKKRKMESFVDKM